TAVGDTTNVAARLQAAAAPDMILISETTYDRVHNLVEAESRGALELKGKSTPVHAYAVLDLRRPRSLSYGVPERELSPFVARRREIENLHDSLAEAEHSRGLVVGVVGEPGMGKSRLLLEFRRSLGDRRLTY